MKRSTLQGLTAAIALCVSAGVQANGVQTNGDDGHGRQCREATLQGLYLFNASGFNIVAGVSQPKAIVELIRFHGDGTLSVPAATVSVNGAITRGGGPGQAGTYTIAADCTGSLVFGPPGPTFDLFAAPRGSEVYMIQTGGAVPAVFQGIAERLSR